MPYPARVTDPVVLPAASARPFVTFAEDTGLRRDPHRRVLRVCEGVGREAFGSRAAGVIS